MELPAGGIRVLIKKVWFLGDIWGLQFDRFLTEDDFNADGSLKAGLPDQTKVFPAGYQFAPGDVLYKDLDNNGEIVKTDQYK